MRLSRFCGFSDGLVVGFVAQGTLDSIVFHDPAMLLPLLGIEAYMLLEDRKEVVARGTLEASDITGHFHRLVLHMTALTPDCNLLKGVELWHQGEGVAHLRALQREGHKTGMGEGEARERFSELKLAAVVALRTLPGISHHHYVAQGDAGLHVDNHATMLGVGLDSDQQGKQGQRIPTEYVLH